MRFNLPKNDSRYHWTQHCIRKMMFYGLTADRIKRILRNPKRVESGIAENTVAVMNPAGTNKKPSEIWVMYQNKNQNAKIKIASDTIKTQNFGKKIIISAWRYPGVSPVRDRIPIPRDILEELREGNYLEDESRLISCHV